MSISVLTSGLEGDWAERHRQAMAVPAAGIVRPPAVLRSDAAPSGPRQTLATITEQRALGGGLYELWLHAPGLLGAVPGQFLHVQVGNALLRRPFSLFQERQDEVALLYQVKGKGTRWMAERRRGDTLDVLGPLGQGFTPPAPGERLLLIGGGIGVAPLALYAQRHQGGIVGHAVTGFRSAVMVAGVQALAAAGLSVEVFTDDGSLGRPGRVTESLGSTLARQRITRVLTCGPEAMMAAVTRIAADAGVPCEASLERPMGCGIGVCLGCVAPVRDAAGTVHLRRTCMEGPVFAGQEVVW